MTTKKPVLKSNRVQVSGYVLMKDPKDQVKIEDLRRRLNIAKVDLANAVREVKQQRKRINELQPLARMRGEAADLMASLNRFGNQKIKDFIYDWPDTCSTLAHFSRKPESVEK